MTTSAQWKAYSIVGFIALASDLVWMVLAPLYEEGVSVFITPLLCLLGVLFFSLYLRKSVWAYQYSPYYAIGTGVVMVLFIGESSKFYGKYDVAMNVVEVGTLVSSVALLAVYFLPAVRSHFRAMQTNKTMEPTR